MAAVKFFDDFGMDFAVRCVLSGVRDGMAEVGEIFATVEQVADGDANGWFDAWIALGRSCRSIADAASAAEQRESAHGAYLRAANYLFAGGYYAPQTSDPSRARGVWEEHRHAWDLAVAHWPTPAQAITITFGEGALPGYRFEARDNDPDAPVVIIVNGIDTPMSDTTMTGLCAGLARGYEVICFDGPGQGASWIRDGLALTSDWGAVIGAVLDHVAADPVCLMGVNHGGLFVARAAAAHPDRVAALVLDPGVLRITSDDVAGLPDLYRPALGDDSAYALTDDEIAAIASPTYIAVAENAESFAGQGEELAARLGGDVHVDHFTAAEGAALDCEILAPQVRNQRVYDWLATVLG